MDTSSAIVRALLDGKEDARAFIHKYSQPYSDYSVMFHGPCYRPVKKALTDALYEEFSGINIGWLGPLVRMAPNSLYAADNAVGVSGPLWSKQSRILNFIYVFGRE